MTFTFLLRRPHARQCWAWFWAQLVPKFDFFNCGVSVWLFCCSSSSQSLLQIEKKWLIRLWWKSWNNQWLGSINNWMLRPFCSTYIIFTAYSFSPFFVFWCKTQCKPGHASVCVNGITTLDLLVQTAGVCSEDYAVKKMGWNCFHVSGLPRF